MQLTITSASEAHLVADELAEAGIGVIVTPPRSYVRMLLVHRRTDLLNCCPPAVYLGRTQNVSHNLSSYLTSAELTHIRHAVFPARLSLQTPLLATC